MNKPSVGEHDRIIAAMLMPGKVSAVDLKKGKVRITSREGWVSPWIRWFSKAAGSARHWRAPSMNEQGMIFNPSGQPGLGGFAPGLFSEAGGAPDDRDHVEVWEFPDGGRLVYDWEAKTYDITLPTGTVTTKVGSTTSVVTDNAASIKVGGAAFEMTPGSIKLTGEVQIVGGLKVTQDIFGGGQIIDTGGNTPNHKH